LMRFSIRRTGPQGDSTIITSTMTTSMMTASNESLLNKKTAIDCHYRILHITWRLRILIPLRPHLRNVMVYFLVMNRQPQPNPSISARTGPKMIMSTRTGQRLRMRRTNGLPQRQLAFSLLERFTGSTIVTIQPVLHAPMSKPTQSPAFAIGLVDLFILHSVACLNAIASALSYVLSV